MSDTNSQNMNDKQAIQALKKNGGNIILAIVVVLAGYFGWSYFQKTMHATVDTGVSDKFFEMKKLNDSMIALENIPQKTDENKKTLETQQKSLDAKIDDLVINHGNNIYAWQALMIKARDDSEKGNSEAVIESLKSANKMELNDPGLKAITRLRYAQALFANGKIKEAKEAISHDMPGSFEATKQELLGDIYLKMDDKESAIRSYKNAWDLLNKRKENRPLLMMKMEDLNIPVEPIETRKLFKEGS